MPTDCISDQLEFQGLTHRTVVASFDGGTVSSDGGVLLLSEVDRRLGLLELFAACFKDHRKPELVEHSIKDLVRQRVFGLALGYEDLNDHDELRPEGVAPCGLRGVHGGGAAAGEPLGGRGGSGGGGRCGLVAARVGTPYPRRGRRGRFAGRSGGRGSGVLAQIGQVR